MEMIKDKDPSIGTSNTADPNSFAYSTARERWPLILNSAMEELKIELTRNEMQSHVTQAGQQIVSKFEMLKASMAGNEPLVAIPDDGEPDVKYFNEELRTMGHPTWLASPWLYTECYMYRLIRTFFSMSTPFWQNFDVFVTSKRESLVASEKGVVELVKGFLGVLGSIASKEASGEETQSTVFEEMIDISLWGNATDLSLLASLSIEELQSRQGKAARESSKSNVIVDDTKKVWELLSRLRTEGSPGEVHIVLDNAGFELLADLVLAGYLIHTKFARKIVLHGKCMPWFVSDVNSRDLDDLIHGFANGTIYQDMDSKVAKELQEIACMWQALMDFGKMEFRAHPFWTTQHSYGRIADVEPTLFSQLAGADLVIFKGDLNYRKLTYDCLWPKTTLFGQALGPLAKQQKGTALRILALRTCKADVCVGLSPGQEEKLPEDWTRTGRYAVVSYWDAKE